MLLTTAKIQVLRSLEFSLYLWRKWRYEAGFHNVSIHLLDSFCLSSRPSLHFFTLLWVSRNLSWLSMALLPFGPQGSISRGLEGGRGQWSAPFCLITAQWLSPTTPVKWLSPLSTLCLWGLVTIPSFHLGVVTPAVPAPALIPCGFSTSCPHLCK